jgi:hypothetical protein
MRWKNIEFEDIPSRDEFESLTLSLLQRGTYNSDRMRDTIRRERGLILSKATGRWNETPSDKFVNEHAWALEKLVVDGRVKKIADKEYRLIHPK